MIALDVVISAANYSETLQKVAQRGGDPHLVAREIPDQGIGVEPVTGADALAAALLWAGAPSLSLGDRLCLALADRLDCPAYTTDQAWRALPHAHVIDRGRF